MVWNVEAWRAPQSQELCLVDWSNGSVCGHDGLWKLDGPAPPVSPYASQLAEHGLLLLGRM
jgi:hypothetical protein